MTDDAVTLFETITTSVAIGIVAMLLYFTWKDINNE